MRFSNVRSNRQVMVRAQMVTLLATGLILLLAVAPAADSISPAGTQPGSQPGDAAGKAPKQRFEKIEYNFGEIWSGQEILASFVLHNDGDAPLVVTKVQPSCGCTKAEEFDQTIQPGKQVTMKFKIHTQGMRGTVGKNVTIETNDKVAQQPTALNITGTIKARVAIEPQQGAQFGAVLVTDEIPTRTITLVNNTEKPMKLEPKPGEPTGIFTYTMKEVEPGKKVELIVKVNRPAGPGSFDQPANSARLAFTTGLTEEPEVFVPCYLYVRPMVEVIPANQQIVLPLQQEWRQDSIQVQNNGTAPMKITSVQPSHPQIKVETTEATPGKLYRLAVTIPPGFDPQPSEAVRLLIRTDVTETPELTVSFLVQRMPQTQPTPPSTGG